MFFFFTFGFSNYPSVIKGFEGIRFYCPRCHNFSLEAQKDHNFFTFCFVPLIPISFSKNLVCTICNHKQATDMAQLEAMKAQQQQQQQQQQPQTQYQPLGDNNSAGNKQGYQQGYQNYQAQQQGYSSQGVGYPGQSFNGEYNAPPPQYK